MLGMLGNQVTEWVMRVVVCMHFATGKERDTCGIRGSFLGGVLGASRWTRREVGIAEEARAPFGRAGWKGTLFSTERGREGGQRQNVISEVKKEHVFPKRETTCFGPLKRPWHFCAR